MMSYRLTTLACLLSLALALPAGKRAAAQESRAEGDAIQVMTYNIRYLNNTDGEDVWSNRADKVAETIALADVAGLQEAVADQVDDLARRLPEYAWIGVGRTDGKRDGEMVPIFYRKDRIKLIAGDTFWLSETPDTIGSRGWDAALPRHATWAVFQDIISGKQFLMVNTHFDHRGQQARLESARLLAKRLEQNHPQLPLILTGDFNCRPDSEPYAVLTAGDVGLHFTDTLANYQPQGDQPAGTWNGFKEIQSNRIDFIFTARGAHAQETKILDPRTSSGRFASDHLPVLTSLVP